MLHSRAFTLIEVLIVVIIIGILAAAIIPQFTSAADDSRTSTAAIIVRSIQRKTNEQYIRTGIWPSTIEADWFEGGQIPKNPLAPDVSVLVQVVTSATLLNPSDLAVTDTNGAYWYNAANGIVRARVPAGNTSQETADLYNTVNTTNVAVLSKKKAVPIATPISLTP